MQRRVEHLVDAALLDDAPGVHHADAVGEAGDHREVVRDPDQRRARFAAQLLRLVEDLRLDRDVERGGRLVRDDELRPVEQCDGDGDALAHAAGELVRVGAQARVGRGDSNTGERGARLLACLCSAHVLVRAHCLDHLRVDAQHRVERHHRVLEHHRDARAAHLAHFLLGQADEVAAFEDDAAADDAPRRIDQPQDREAGDGLAAARLADQSQHLARAQREAHPVDRAHHAGAREEMGPEVLDRQDRISAQDAG